MPGGCWVCNPLCGKCQPAVKKSLYCTQCSALNIFDKAEIIAREPLLCKKCGVNLGSAVYPAAIHCNYSGLICAYPCGKGTGEKPSRGFQVCKRNTKPLTTEELA